MSYYDPIISFRIDSEQYAKLKEYAKANGLSTSETVRRAIRWMMILNQQQPKEMKKR
jgi:hypothetical protein